MTKTPVKDPSILYLLDRLWLDLGCHAFDIVDHWDGDLISIGLASPKDHRVLAYISTLNLPPDTYLYELELPPTSKDSVHSVAAECDACTYSELLDALRSHWNISC